MRTWQRKPLIPAQGETILWHVYESLNHKDWEIPGREHSGTISAGNARIDVYDLIYKIQRETYKIEVR